MLFARFVAAALPPSAMVIAVKMALFPPVMDTKRSAGGRLREKQR
jgi:hypothetical protein